MVNLSIIDRRRAEIKNLIKFQSHIAAMQIIVGLSDESANSIIEKINHKISQKERAIFGDQIAISNK